MSYTSGPTKGTSAEFETQKMTDLKKLDSLGCLFMHIPQKYLDFKIHEEKGPLSNLTWNCDWLLQCWMKRS